ncbi:MAG: sigma-70 family RNA polymerase sigma factor [Proteobacteria bacterium]|jgi:RNA polymerase sigma factor (sigma-70 family)|nr:sigma-70 family RNA polymerase sigma factor [Pseudomonadota bacterium]
MPTLDVETELRALFVCALAGDDAAYRLFLRRLAGHLRAYLGRRLFGWPDDVEDLVQECLLAIHNKRHTWLPAQPLSAWVHAIARHKLIDLLRARSVREALHEPLDAAEELFASNQTAAHEARRDVLGLLQELPDKQRLPILHVKIEGLSVAETARRTGLSESAVKVGIHRGLKALARRFGVADQGQAHAQGV